MSKTRVFAIRLDPRQAWAWRHLGGDGIRNLIAKDGTCIACGHRKARTNTRNGWFCYPCQDDLDQANLLPEDRVSQLVEQNRELRSEVKRLQARVESSRTERAPPVIRQLSLFEEPPS